MPKDKYTAKQMKIARVAEPRDEITGADFEKLNNSKAMGGMIKYAEGGDTRREMLMQLREDAVEKGDDDAIIEIDAELFQMGDDGDTKKFRYGGKVKMARGGCVKCMGSCSCGTKARGMGAAMSGTKYSGTY
jgi:hypothetical protein